MRDANVPKTHFKFPGKGQVATVFGGSGFIGSYIVRELAAQGWIVRVACRRPSRAHFLKPCGDVGQIVPVFAPVYDRDKVRGAAKGARIVINASGTGSFVERGRQTFDGINNKGAAVVAAACREFGIQRLVHLSAIGADIRSDSVYARSKAAGEESVFNRCPAATVLRPSVVFGPEDDFFNRFAGMARLSPVLPLIGGGETRLQPVYAGDVGDAVIASLAGAQTEGEIYELGGPQIKTFKELMELMLELIQRRRRLQTVPFGLANSIARISEALPNAQLTLDQVRQLKTDNVVDGDALALSDLGIKPTAMRAVLPSYLERFRPGGRFTVRKRYKGVRC